MIKLKKLSSHEKATWRIWTFVALVLVVIALGVFGVYPNNSLSLLKPLNGFVMYFALACLVFCIINLFNKETVPGELEFDNRSYFSLLFTLGMGVGIMIYGFNESAQLAQYAECRNPLGLTLNHWICIPWVFYVTFTIFEVYDQKYNILPNWLRMIKTYLYGIMMMLGIGTSFALGVTQISSSLNIIYGIDVPSYALVILLGAAVTVSLLRGIHKGMKVFAKVSMYMLYAFMIILAIVAPQNTMTEGIKGIGSFFSDFIYNNVYRGSDLQNDWTVYYWIWWLSWSAFCAPFIARISKGRSIRSVILWAVVAPSLLIALYMILGNTYGMSLLQSGTEISMIPYDAINVHWILPVFFIILMSMFYITSSDSQSFAMDELISKGSRSPVVMRKLLWILLEVVFVTVLLLAGSGTTSAIQGLSFLMVPLMMLFAIINVVLIVRLVLTKNSNKKIKS